MATPYERTVDYTDEQRENSGELFRAALKEKQLTIAQAAANIGVNEQNVRTLTRTIPPGMSWALVVKIAIGLGIDLYSLAQVQGLTDMNAIDATLFEVPPESRDQAKKAFTALLSSFK